MGKSDSVKSNVKSIRTKKNKVVSPPGNFKTIAEKTPLHDVESYLWKPLGATLPEVLESQFQWDVRTSRGCQTHWPWVAVARRWGRAKVLTPSPHVLPPALPLVRRNTLDGPETLSGLVMPLTGLPHRADSEELTLVTAESIRNILKSNVFTDQKPEDDEELPPGVPRRNCEKTTDTADLEFDPFDPNMKYTKIPTTIMPAYIPAEVAAVIKPLPQEETAFMAFAREQDEKSRSKRSSKTDISKAPSSEPGVNIDAVEPEPKDGEAGEQEKEKENENENENKSMANKNANKTMNKETELKLLFPPVKKSLNKKNKNDSLSSAGAKQLKLTSHTKPEIEESDDVISVSYVETKERVSDKNLADTKNETPNRSLSKATDKSCHGKHQNNARSGRPDQLYNRGSAKQHNNEKSKGYDIKSGRPNHHYTNNTGRSDNNGVYKAENNISAAALARGYRPPIGLPPINERMPVRPARNKPKSGDDSAFSEPSSAFGRRKTKRCK